MRNIPSVPYIAGYIVLRDSDFEPVVGDHDTAPALPVNLPPAGVVFNKPAILAYVADPSIGADNLHYKVMYRYVWQGETTDEVVLWDRDIKSGMFIGGVKRGLWEVIPGGVLRTNVVSSDVPINVPDHGEKDYGTLSQAVVFEVESGSGTVKFSDVVLWFMAEAPPE